MNENDLQDDLRNNLKADKNIFKNLKIDNQYEEVPDWEDKFINTIEKMNTIPYVLLGHFQFLTINWIDESINENESKETEGDQIEIKKSISHWDLVKRMIFSKVIASSPFKLKQIANTLKTNQLNNQSSKKLVSQPSFNKNNYSQKFKDQFSDVYNQFVDLIKIKKEKSQKKLTRKPKKVKIHSTNISKSISREFENLKNEESSKKNLVKKQISKKKITNKNNDGLIDLDDIIRKKKLYKLSLIMSKDDGPFLTDYRFLLGIEFWSNFCNIDKYQLMSICSNNYWLNELKSFTSGKLTELRDGYSKETNKNGREFSYLKELKQFLKGTDRPARAPQRIISPEEKFRLIPYPKLFNPNTDLKKTFHFHTMQDQLNKKIKKLYVSIVNLIGGKYPLKRTVGFEEAYEDNLLWVLDTYQGNYLN